MCGGFSFNGYQQALLMFYDSIESYVVKGKTICSISVTSKDELYISCMESGLIKLYKAKL